MRKVVACILIAVLCLGSLGLPTAQAAEKGGVLGFLAGCCLGIRVGTQYNEGKDIHWREWAPLLPLVGVVVSIWNGIDCGITEKGVRGMKFGIPPKWNTATVPVSSQAFQAGSHSSP